MTFKHIAIQGRCKMATASKKKDGPIVIKKYANRRLYDTGRSSYVTLEDLCQMVKDGQDFIVYDAKSGDDLTRQVLTQIILDQESKGENMLPESFLKQLIGFYGDSLQSVVPNYLEQAFEAFAKNQEDFRAQMQKSMENMSIMNPMASMPSFEDINRQNRELFENAMKAWAPFNPMNQTDKK